MKFKMYICCVMMQSQTEENYIKAIFSLGKISGGTVSTNAIAEHLETKPSSVTDMLKRLNEKKLINYQKYKGVSLKNNGKNIALSIVRKHRLWETFLVNKLSFEWHQVHDIAEQLEHINSTELVDRLDDFLGNPKFDPHGDPIPDKNFKIAIEKPSTTLNTLAPSKWAMIVGVSNTNDDFLSYLSELGIGLGTKVQCKQRFQFDNTLSITINQKEILLPEKISQTILIQAL
jgi:DtxR family transcriptional regulator, Mn-dependent transcriptional regulator